MFKIHALPARFGDSLLITYGDPAAPHRILIDGGTGGTRHDLKRALGDHTALELLVVTHIDSDHIEGVLEWLDEADHTPETPLAIGDIWFNGWFHLPQDADQIEGALQGERLSQQISAHNLPWNNQFSGTAVVLSPDDQPLPQRILPGGMVITLLSPTSTALARLRPVWNKEVRAAGLIPGTLPPPDDDEAEPEPERELPALPNIEALSQSPFQRDTSEANASSIAFLAEYEGKRVLFGADAHADTLIASLQRYARETAPCEADARVRLDLCKLSHHGSRGTTSLDLLRHIECRTWLLSSNGSRYRHPDAETIARVLKAGGDTPELIFNYRSASNALWDNPALKQQHNYTTRYPTDNKSGIETDL